MSRDSLIFVADYYPNDFHYAVIPNMASADLNNDGRTDIVFSGWAYWNNDSGESLNQPAYVKIFSQQPDGSMRDETQTLLGNVASALYADQAGLDALDLAGATGNIVYGSNRILLGDYDSNGFIDIFLPGFMDVPVEAVPSTMFWNEGGAFTRDDFDELVWSHGALSADINFDGLPDLWATGYGLGGIYVNQGNRKFDFTYQGELYADMLLLDQSNGVTTLLVTNNYNSIPPSDGGPVDWIMRIDSDLQVLSMTGLPGTSIDSVDDVNTASIDVNGDGFPDLLIGSQREDLLRVYLGSENFEFSQTTQYQGILTSTQWPGYYNQVVDFQGDQLYYLPGADRLYLFGSEGIRDYSHIVSQVIGLVSENKNDPYSADDATLYFYQNPDTNSLHALIYFPHEFWTVQVPVFSSIVDGKTHYVLPDRFTGSASLNLDYQLIDETPNAVVTGSSANDFIKVANSASIGKAVDAGDGDDVIDGGVGSAFITGGGGSNTFFLDGRAAGVSWSSITDFKQGLDKATVWGWRQGVSTVAMVDENGGADGYKGLTLHFEHLLPSGASDNDRNTYLNSITFTGKSLSDFGADSLEALNAQIASGENPFILVGQTVDEYGTHGYLHFT